MEDENMEERCNELYQKIFNQIEDLIPDKWKKIYLYGEVLPDSVDMNLYFESATKNELINAMYIDEIYNLNSDKQQELRKKIRETIRQLKRVYAEEMEDKVWSNFTMVFEEDGKINIDFDYTDIPKSDTTVVDRHIIWEYEVLKKMPESTKAKNVIKRYLAQKE